MPQVSFLGKKKYIYIWYLGTKPIYVYINITYL